MMDAHELDVTLKALDAGCSGIGEVLSSGNVHWSDEEDAALRRASKILSDTRRGLRLTEVS